MKTTFTIIHPDRVYRNSQEGNHCCYDHLKAVNQYMDTCDDTDLIQVYCTRCRIVRMIEAGHLEEVPPEDLKNPREVAER
jgi:hypothetical protein